MRTTKELAILSVCELYDFAPEEIATVRRIVESCPDRRNYSTDVEFYRANAKWGGENQPILIGMALNDIFSSLYCWNGEPFPPENPNQRAASDGKVNIGLAEERTSLRERAVHFVLEHGAHDITVRTFMNIFDYWATGRNDWKSIFPKAAFATEAFEVFEKFLVEG